MLKSAIEDIQPQLDQQHLGGSTGKSIIDQQIAMYEQALQPQTDAFAHQTEHVEYQKSFRAALELYKSGKLDGTSTTFLCSGKVIKVENLEDLPDYTIVDLPSIEQNHCRVTYGAKR